MTSITGHCPTCGARRNAEVINEHEEIIEPTDESPTLAGYAYRMLRCAGCNEIYFQREEVEVMSEYYDDEGLQPDFEQLKDYVAQLNKHHPESILREETRYWPEPERSQPDWSKLADAPLIKLLHSVYTALENDLRVLAAIGMRVVFERAAELMGVDHNQGFAKKLDQLHREGLISATDRKTLEVLTEAGNAAAHRGWEPEPAQVRVLLSIMEQFVRARILERDAAELKGVIPLRQKQRATDDQERSAQLIEFPPPKVV